jgi:DNA-binding SARP family transcriptional activator
MRRPWPADPFLADSTDAQARTNLRQLVHHLRHALPDADLILYSDAACLQWQPVVLSL